MKTLFRIIRAILVTAVVVPLALPVILYVAVSFDSTRGFIARTASRELTDLLGTEVSIGDVDFAPFNRIVLRDVTVETSPGDTILNAGHVGAGISIIETIWHRKPVITYAELLDVDFRLNRPTPGAPLNLTRILDRFKKKDKTGPSQFDLSVRMVVVRRSSFSYDILDAPDAEDGRLDPNHLRLDHLRADLRAPRISDSRIEVDIKRLAAEERSGLTLTSLEAKVAMDSASLTLSDPVIELPESRLALGDITVTPSPLAQGFRPELISTSVSTLPDTYIALSDLAPLLPDGMETDDIVDLHLEAEGSLKSLAIRRLSAQMRDGDTFVALHGTVAGLDALRDSLHFDFPRVNAILYAPTALRLLGSVSPKLSRLATGPLASLSGLGEVNLMTSGEGTASRITANGSIITDCGDLDLSGTLSRPRPGVSEIDASVDMIELNPSGLLPALARLTDVSLRANARITLSGGTASGRGELFVEDVVYGGLRYTDISAEARITPEHIELQAESGSPHLDFSFWGGHDFKGDRPLTEGFAEVRNVDLSPFVKSGPFSETSVAGTLNLKVTGRTPDDLDGWANVGDIVLTSPRLGSLSAGSVAVESHRPTDEYSTRTIHMRSTPLDLSLSGDFTFASLASGARRIASELFPSLVEPNEALAEVPYPSADLRVTFLRDTILNRLFKLPVEVIHPIDLRASTMGGAMSLRLDAPYLKQKNKLIENTSLSLDLTGPGHSCTMRAATRLSTKHGPLDLELLTMGLSDSLDTKIRWKVEREADFHGDFDLGVHFSRGELPEGARRRPPVLTDVVIHPTVQVVNDTVWDVAPALISIHPGEITVSDFNISRPGQHIAIDGVASADSLSRVTIDLDHFDLDYLFETLAIGDAVIFGGTATGQFYGDALLSREPVLFTPSLHVDHISYNHCVMGDADIVSAWDNAAKRITIDADIAGKEGRLTKILGSIRPMTEELDFRFKADRAPTGFLQPFMAAFATKVGGEVSGDAHLWGTFKNIDLEGKVFADNFNVTLGFTNCTYFLTDSVAFTPGRIAFKDVGMRDRYGNTAEISGELKHTFFHDPTFRFEIKNASDLLVYDISRRKATDPWYGRVFGRGSATVDGVPGRILIGVNMRTEPKSTFTFVLDDSQESVDYDFITFRDRDKARKDSLAALDPTPRVVRELRARAGQVEEGPPTAYVLDFEVDITPEATLNLIMDPVGGDKIVANGSGHLGMSYDSQGELVMRGDYTLERGTYTFTLQDIIIKDFNIREGSTIRFSGDPYAAQLDITAAYPVNANLTDLDESFKQDPELNRTNVKVNALMKITGDMRSPDIGYDLEFPTLTSDIDRKVRSIISTDEMMGQQIIYLLALNRFYTPEYMAATHGNELVSVASSTLSSQLGSMLGALSDAWSIAPAIRSDKGDFSDVEVDVALSSQLLDNRLLFNGNFGYRDKSLNNNSFIGDFDIRYLLNRAGTIQLKAYNRYNDQNYYLKSALTTQGIGVVFKRDFDNIFSFLRPWLNRKKEKEDDNAVETDEK
ncbi:MAG: translocation/assembly module TamB [Duncaniella sp.]|nr:translocation/assembly module TamB [Duncaniella sp.]